MKTASRLKAWPTSSCVTTWPLFCFASCRQMSRERISILKMGPWRKLLHMWQDLGWHNCANKDSPWCHGGATACRQLHCPLSSSYPSPLNTTCSDSAPIFTERFLQMGCAYYTYRHVTVLGGCRWCFAHFHQRNYSNTAMTDIRLHVQCELIMCVTLTGDCRANSLSRDPRTPTPALLYW